ncbi:MAG: response regulator transcription factor [Planctomycetes bacterium]|nr:response regulator transcription factor [Planctomycetota bacterium]MCB9872500.1 response regulator transcription factor [Planctomycetota bacterium]
MARKIVVIEDEPDILEVLTFNLQREGYEVTGATDGADGLDTLRRVQPDLVLLDLMLPTMDGIEVCRNAKADPALKDTPIIVVSAKGEESDIVLGLGVGADDYITKPFSPKELIARVQAVLRRGPMRSTQSETRRVVRGELTIDLDRHEVLVAGARVDLTATEMRLLHYLSCYPGRVFTRDQLLSRAIGPDVVVTDRNIDVHVRALRKKLDTLSNYIETVRGVGYRFRDTD